MITPRYFLSPECRRELQEFSRGAEARIRELILPLLYADVPALNQPSPVDEAIALVKTYQREDWREIRFEDSRSGTYRRAVAALAQRLADAGQRVIAAESERPPPDGQTVATADGEQGTLDLLAAMEEALPELSQTIEGIGTEVAVLGAAAEGATSDIRRGDEQGKGFAARLIIARRVPQELSEPAERILALTNRYTRALYDVDAGVRAIINNAPRDSAADPSAESAWRTFAEIIATLTQTTNQSVSTLETLTQALSQGESLSRDLRPPLQNVRRGLTSMIEGSAVINEWHALAANVNAD